MRFQAPAKGWFAHISSLIAHALMAGINQRNDLVGRHHQMRLKPGQQWFRSFGRPSFQRSSIFLAPKKRKREENTISRRKFPKKFADRYRFLLSFLGARTIDLLAAIIRERKKEKGRPRDLWKGIQFPSTETISFITIPFFIQEWRNREGNVLWKIECFLED